MAKAKIRAERAHAKRRSAERYNLSLNRKKYKEYCDLMREQNFCHFQIEKQSNARSIHLLHADKQWYTVVWDRNHGTIVTFLPNKIAKKYPQTLTFLEDEIYSQWIKSWHSFFHKLTKWFNVNGPTRWATKPRWELRRGR